MYRLITIIITIGDISIRKQLLREFKTTDITIIMRESLEEIKKWYGKPLSQDGSTLTDNSHILHTTIQIKEMKVVKVYDYKLLKSYLPE
jgi:hypothetical protein